jgi:hypothetical protein
MFVRCPFPADRSNVGAEPFVLRPRPGTAVNRRLNNLIGAFLIKDRVGT